jgi:hypothetical protein
MEYADCVRALRPTHAALAEKVAPFTSLRHVLDWLESERYSLGQLDMITQDEFCHDLIFPMAGGPGFLAFGMT